MILAIATCGQAKDVTVKSPNGALVVTVSNNDGRLTYGVTMDGQTVLRESALGLRTSIGDLTQGLTLTDTKENRVEAHYDMQKTKTGHSDYVANELTATLKNDEKRVLQVTFRVSNDDVAFRYSIAVEHPEREADLNRTLIYGEASSFNFPESTTTYLCPMAARPAELRGGLYARRTDGGEVAVRSRLLVPLHVPSGRQVGARQRDGYDGSLLRHAPLRL